MRTLIILFLIIPIMGLTQTPVTIRGEIRQVYKIGAANDTTKILLSADSALISTTKSRLKTNKPFYAPFIYQNNKQVATQEALTDSSYLIRGAAKQELQDSCAALRADIGSGSGGVTPLDGFLKWDADSTAYWLYPDYQSAKKGGFYVDEDSEDFKANGIGLKDTSLILRQVPEYYDPVNDDFVSNVPLFIKGQNMVNYPALAIMGGYFYVEGPGINIWHNAIGRTNSIYSQDTTGLNIWTQNGSINATIGWYNGDRVDFLKTGAIKQYSSGSKVFSTDASGNIYLQNKFTLSVDSSNIRAAATKWHRVDSINSPEADVWKNIKFDTNIANETTYGIAANSDSTGFIMQTAGLFKMSGCGHWVWNGASGTTAKMYIRVTVNGTEKRCLQANDTRTNGTGDDGTLVYSGTIRVNPGDLVRVQYRVDNAEMDFEGDAVFDSPIAFSMNMFKISADENNDE